MTIVFYFQVFSDIGAIGGLQEAAKRGSRLTAKLCCQALATCDATPPPYQCWDVLRWTTKNVAAWVEDIGLKELAPSFEDHLVTGNTLVDVCLLYTSPSPRDATLSRMPSSA